MPFTFSHPAAIIPLLYARQRYRWVSATGLIAGSVAPDFEKFFRLRLASGHSHTLGSIFYFSYPVALGLAFFFHLFIRRPLVSHLPVALYRRLGRYRDVEWLSHWRGHQGGVLGSIGVGAVLHLFWDSFTHQHALLIGLLPGLASSVQCGPWTMPLFQVLGLLSSAAGMLVIGAVTWRLPVQAVGPVPSPPAVRRYWGKVALVTSILTVGWAWAVRPQLLAGSIATISAILVGIVVASVSTNRRNLIPKIWQGGRGIDSKRLDKEQNPLFKSKYGF